MTQTTDHNEQVIDQFTRQAEGYTRLTNSMASDRTAELRALIGPTADDLALDVACGPGSLAIEISPFVNQVTGVDLTPAMLDQAKAAQTQKGINNINWKIADVCQLPFDDASFSLVLCRAAFHHLERSRKALGEMVRVCRTGGRVAVIDVTPPPDKVAAYDAIEKIRDPSHVHAHTLEELRALSDGLPLSDPTIKQHAAATVALDAVLATSFPVGHSIDEIRNLYREDAVSGEDRLGLSATLVQGVIYVSYLLSTVAWTKH